MFVRAFVFSALPAAKLNCTCANGKHLDKNTFYNNVRKYEFDMCGGNWTGYQLIDKMARPKVIKINDKVAGNGTFCVRMHQKNEKMSAAAS